jgi:hypothetical protein
VGSQSVRWTIALLVVMGIAVLAGAGIWQLGAAVWHWPRADVIAAASGVALGVIALGVAPAQAWASSAAEGREQRGIAIVRSQAGRHIVARAGDTIRIDCSSAAGDIRATQSARPLREASEDEEDDGRQAK